MTDLAGELDRAGGAAAPPSATARLREVLLAALRHGAAELAKPRSGYDAPVEVAIAAGDGGLLAATPAAAALRADPERSRERAWLLVAATVAALVELAGRAADRRRDDLRSPRATSAASSCSRSRPAARHLDELVPLAFDDHAGGIDRLRARALALPARVLGGRAARPIGDGHPLRIAEAVARLGGRPEDPRSVEEHEDAVLGLLEPGGGAPSGRTRTPTRPGASRGGSSSGSTAWARGRLPHGLRAPPARVRRQRPRARPGRGGGAARGGAARREAVGGPAPRVPEPAPGGRHPPAHRRRRRCRRACGCPRLKACRSMDLARKRHRPGDHQAAHRSTLVEAGILQPDRPDQLLGAAGR